MPTARVLIQNALRPLQVLGVGQSLSAEDAADGLKVLNNMLSFFSTKISLVYTETNEQFNLTNGVISYTLGPGGDFNTVRPTQILAAYIEYAGDSYKLREATANQYAGFEDKDEVGIPSFYYDDGGFPLRTLRLFSAPFATMVLFLTSIKQLTSFASLNTDIDLPPGYEPMITYNLSTWLAPEYNRAVPDDVRKMANDTMAAIKSLNLQNKNTPMSSDAPMPESVRQGYFNILSGSSQ